MALSFDPNQLKAIQTRSNTVVTAGAGSGKTSVLAERFCWLLENRAAGVDRILALTFTQKAAAEMYERIHARLLGGSAALRQSLEHFDQAQVSTLDSFCAEIVRNSAADFGLPAELRYDEEAVARLAEQASLDFLLANLDHPALQELLHLHDFQTIWRDLLADLALHHLHLPGDTDFAGMVQSQLERCRADLERVLGEVRQLAGEVGRIEPRLDSIRSNQESLLVLKEAERLLGQERWREAGQLVAAIRLRKPGGRGAEDLQVLKELIDRIRPALHSFNLLSFTLAQEQTLRGVFGLLQRFCGEFVESKRRLGLVTFQDVAELSVKALLRNKPLRQYYKRKYRYIMIDEFQDNNQLQKDLLYLLAERLQECGDLVPSAQQLEEDKLFFVGDEKQSIYRFRGADVSVFKVLHEELERSGGRTVQLDRNYRSESGLIDLYNRVFSAVLGQARLDFEARFQSMSRGGEDSPFPAQVHLLYGDFADEGGEEEALAQPGLAEASAVVRFIHQAVEQGSLPVAENGAVRPAGYRDFAILFRSTGNQIHYERLLRHFGIPYSTRNVRSLFVEAPANDLYLLLQLAVYPEDRSAYTGLLRSPFVNVSDETVIRLSLLFAERPEPFSGIAEALLPEEERRRLERGAEVYAFVREWMDRLPVSELLHRLWYHFGYRYSILKSPRNHNYLEYYDYLLAFAERSDRQGDSLAVFLDSLRANLGKYERLQDIDFPETRLPGVQLLTIHRAKGLEFPVVVLADAGNLGRSGGPSSPYYLCRQHGITINLGGDNYFTRIGEQENAEKELAEIKRLLYVALTRARHHLLIAGIHKKRNRESPRSHLNLLLGALGLSPDTIFDPERRSADGSVLAIGRIEAFDRELRPRQDGAGRASTGRTSAGRASAGRASAGRASPDLAELDRLYRGEPLRRRAARRDISVTELCRHLQPLLAEPAGPAAAEELPALALDGLLAREKLESRFGALTHHLLDLGAAAVAASAGTGAPSSPDALPEPDWSRLRIPLQHRAALLQGAGELCRNFFDSELGSRLRRAARIESEFPYLHRLDTAEGPLYLSGQIDLLFEEEDRLCLVDFKTDSRYRPGEHEAQLGLYSLAMAELSEKPIAACLFLLRSGRAVHLDRQLDWKRLIEQARPLL